MGAGAVPWGVVLVLTMSTESADAVVIGAGVVGLAVARALAQAGREVLILEATSTFGSGTSSRNSEVLHAGLYYPTGSLKARACVAGRRALVDYARARGVAHALCGKLVVATTPLEVAAIERLQAQALANGVEGTVLISGEAARTLEPALQAVAALHSMATGIIDSHALMTSLLGDAQAMGAALAVCSPVLGGEVQPDGSVELQVGGTEPMRLHARTVINAAGLTAPAVSRSVAGVPSDSIPRERFCKGHYFSLGMRSPFSRLIYPVHTAAGLGTHLTLDLGGQARFGPDVEWLDEDGLADEAGGFSEGVHGVQAVTPDRLALDYAVDEHRVATFEKDIRRYWPGLPSGVLQPAYTGVRPKIVGPGEPAADFVLSTPREHGVEGWLALYGVESPGLTACLALADEVVKALDDRV